MFNFVKIILATKFTDIFSNLFSNSNNFNNITNLDINKNVNTDIEYYSVNDNLKNINNINNLNNISTHIIDVTNNFTNNVTNILVKVINSNLSNLESKLLNNSYLILETSKSSNTEVEFTKNATNSNILTGIVVGIVIFIFACAFIKLCSISICFSCIDNTFKCIIFIPRKICKLCFSNKVNNEQNRDGYNINNIN
tara:strand:- start:209 stop:796 length:588 start_codon:yes stop_codon:yes gene_type:complete